MTTTLGFKDVIDVPQWRPCAPTSTASTSVAGSSMCNDARNDLSRDPLIYYLSASSQLDAYSPLNDGWNTKASPALGSFSGGAAIAFHSSQGPRGVLAAGSTTTTVVISTVLPATVGINQLTNNGSGLRGFRIRIIGNAAGSSGKVEERYIVANTAGTAPTITLDSALTFTPATGDAYEILSGRLFMYGSGTTAGTFKYYDVATNSYSGNLASPGTGSTNAASLIPLSEAFVPYNKAPGDGFFGTLVATGSAAGTLTGHATGGDAAVLSNQYRNFQIRIVLDTAIPTAAGQRRRITSHTAGASPVYTLASNWTVTPSTTASYVIENDDDKIICLHNGSASVFNYNIAANTWDSTTWAAASAARGVGTSAAQSHGIAMGSDFAVDGSRHSFIFSFRGGGVATLDVFDISGAATGSWSNGAAYSGNSSIIATTGTSGTYDPVTQLGRYMILNASGAVNFRFDMKARVMESWGYLRYPQGVTLSGGNRMAMAFFQDGATKLSFVYLLLNTSTVMVSSAMHR